MATLSQFKGRFAIGYKREVQQQNKELDNDNKSTYSVI
jgi:hypothetical protein